MKSIKCVMLDLDGTVYLGENIFPYTLDFLKTLNALNIGHIFLTNTNLVNSGLPYIATHPDAVCPAENGFLPDLGSVIELIYACTKRRPQVICGKPNEQILVAAENKTGLKRENLLMVGDRLTTDIAIGAHGVKTALVLSGEATMEDVPSAPHNPTYIFDSIKELGEALKEANK